MAGRCVVPAPRSLLEQSSVSRGSETFAFAESGSSQFRVQRRSRWKTSSTRTPRESPQLSTSLYGASEAGRLRLRTLRKWLSSGDPSSPNPKNTEKEEDGGELAGSPADQPGQPVEHLPDPGEHLGRRRASRVGGPVRDVRPQARILRRDPRRQRGRPRSGGDGRAGRGPEPAA